jgi:hypothetical protein
LLSSTFSIFVLNSAMDFLMDKIVDTVWTFMLFCSSYKLLMIENHKKNSYNAVVKLCLSFLFVIYYIYYIWQWQWICFYGELWLFKKSI